MDTCAYREVNDCGWRLTARPEAEENILEIISHCSDIGGNHGVKALHQEDWREILGEKVELLQISLRLMLGLGDPGQGQEQHGCVGALLPAGGGDWRGEG